MAALFPRGKLRRTIRCGAGVPRGAAQLLHQTATLFAGGELSDDDKLAFVTEIQQLYLDSKERAKKFTPKKYWKNPEDN